MVQIIRMKTRRRLTTIISEVKVLKFVQTGYYSMELMPDCLYRRWCWLHSSSCCGPRHVLLWFAVCELWTVDRRPSERYCCSFFNTCFCSTALNKKKTPKKSPSSPSLLFLLIIIIHFIHSFIFIPFKIVQNFNKSPSSYFSSPFSSFIPPLPHTQWWRCQKLVHPGM